MEEKIKFIIIGAAVLVVTLFGINLHTQGLKRTAERQRDEAKSENASLKRQVEEATKKIAEGLKEKETLKSEIAALNSNFTQLSNEREELKQQYELIAKERDELKEKIGERRVVKEEPQKTSASGDAYWSGVLKAKADLELQLEKTRNDLKLVQINYEQIKKEKEAMELDLKNINRERDDLEEQITYNQKMVDTMTTDLVVERNTKIKSQDELKLVRNENAALRRQLKALSNYKFRLEEKIQKVQLDKETLERRFNEMSLLLENRLTQIGEIKEGLDTIRGVAEEESDPAGKESVELPPILVHPQGRLPSPEEDAFLSDTTEAGKVISVDRESNFLIIDLGRDAGIREGRVFKVYRESSLIGSVEVIQARKSISACDIKKETTPMKVGDTIR